MEAILSIDPGDTESGFVVTDRSDGMKILKCGKVKNVELKADIPKIIEEYNVKNAVMEMIASYGMAVGREVFETCVWIGRFKEVITALGCECDYIYRREEKLYICGDSRAKDANIRRALIDEFAEHDFKSGKGTKKNPDFFYHVSKDAWMAFAVAVTWCRKQEENDV